MTLRRTVSVALMLQVCWALPAAAGDWEGDPTRILGDPGFLPVAGQVEGSFQYSYSVDRYDFRDEYAEDSPRSYDRSRNDFLPQLNFGITDDISVFANLGWGNARNTETYTYDRIKIIPQPPFGPPIFQFIPTKAKIQYHALGANDPVFGATWRVIDQRNAPFSLDITGAYSPDIFKNQAAERTATGSIADGGQSGSVQLAITREMKRLTLRAYGTFGYDGRRNENYGYSEFVQSGPDDLHAVHASEDLRSSAHAVYSAGVQSQLRLLPYLALNAGVEAQQAMHYDRPIINGDDVTQVTIKPSGSISPYAGLVVPVVPGRLVAEALYQHDFINNEANDYIGGATTRYYKQESNEYTARVLFTFGGAAAPLPPAQPAAPPVSAPAPEAARTYLVFFDWDRADLSVRARQIVAEAAQASTHTQTTRIEVDGYTDLSGTRAYNQKLSVRRAQWCAS